MKVSKNNFFIRIYEECYGIYPKSLCGFFWKTIFAIATILTSPIALFLLTIRSFKDGDGVIEFSLVDKIFVTMAIIFATYKDTNYFHWEKLWVGYLSIIFIIFGTFFAVYWVTELIERFNSKSKKEKEPNIMIEAFKSIWNKVCPIVEIVDDETI